MERKKSEILIAYGCPRSGTTYIQSLLDQGVGYVSVKVRESDYLHPVVTELGLIRLSQALRDKRPLFVRIVRNPIDIFESFYAWRLNPDKPNVKDRRIYQLIRNESERSAAQASRSPQGEHRGPFRIVTVRYEDLHTKSGRGKFLAELIPNLPNESENRRILMGYLDETFRKVSVRSGKLSANIKEQLIPDAMRSEIREKLGDVFAREGYGVT